MSIKKIKPKESAFKYDPTAKQLCLVTDAKFYFNFDTQKFEIDQDPYSDPDCTPLLNISLKDDLSELQFDAVYRGKETRFVISITNSCDKILYDFFSRVTNEGFSIAKNDVDDLQLVFENGKLESLKVYKLSKAQELLDSLFIAFDEGRHYLIEEDPWRKIELNAIEATDGKIISKSENEEFIYNLETQPLIFDTVKKLIESS